MFLKSAKRIVVVVIGFTIVLIGIALIVLPGPAIIVIPLGLAVLGTEFLWARKLTRKFKQQAHRITGFEMLRVDDEPAADPPMQETAPPASGGRPDAAAADRHQ